MDYPNYYGILPAAVRYAKIADRAKILFSEITALANKDGYCYASNGYFAALYGCTPQAISKMIKALESANFVKLRYVTIEAENGNISISERQIYPVAMVAPINQELRGYQPQVEGGINSQLRGYQPQVEHNNTSINTTSKNKASTKVDVAKSKKEPLNLGVNMVALFDEYMTEINKPPIVWKYALKEVKAVYEICKKLSVLHGIENTVEEFKTWIRDAYEVTNDEYIKANFTPAVLNSQFDRINQKIKNPIKNNNNGQRKTTGVISQSDFAEVVATLQRR